MTERAREYYDEYWRRPAPPPANDPLAGERLRLLFGSLQGLPVASALDAGCGSGGTVAALAGRGIDAVGLDVSAPAVERATARHPGCRFVQHELEQLPWPVEPESFDLVVSFEVIEHLLRPRRLLEGARRVLPRGGHLALSTPYHGPLKNLALALFAFDRHFAVEGDHVRFFSDRALRRLLEETGFEVLRLSHYGRGPGLWAGAFAWARAG